MDTQTSLFGPDEPLTPKPTPRGKKLVPNLTAPSPARPATENGDYLYRPRPYSVVRVSKNEVWVLSDLN